MAKKGRPVHGWVLLDKPLGLTSTQAVSKVRWLFEAQKAGHGGTLDPLASGLLPIALGEATKTVPFAMEGSKTYEFEVHWGAERSTDDLEGEITATSEKRPEASAIAAVLPEFTGLIKQLPPNFSALKVAGQRAYDLARKGEEVTLQPREVLVERLMLLSSPSPDTARFELRCGKGTYVRSLARDLGRRLGCLAHVCLLRRLSVGPFRAGQMISLERLEEMRHKPPGLMAETGVLLPVATVLDGIPALALADEEARRLRQGQMVLPGRQLPAHADMVLMMSQGQALGIGYIEAGMLKPRRLFNL